MIKAKEGSLDDSQTKQIIEIKAQLYMLKASAETMTSSNIGTKENPFNKDFLREVQARLNNLHLSLDYVQALAHSDFRLTAPINTNNEASPGISYLTLANDLQRDTEQLSKTLKREADSPPEPWVGLRSLKKYINQIQSNTKKEEHFGLTEDDTNRINQLIKNQNETLVKQLNLKILETKLGIQQTQSSTHSGEKNNAMITEILEKRLQRLEETKNKAFEILEGMAMKTVSTTEDVKKIHDTLLDLKMQIEKPFLTNIQDSIRKNEVLQYSREYDYPYANDPSPKEKILPVTLTHPSSKSSITIKYSQISIKRSR